MKIIDLLNKIAKGELPNKTRFKVYSSCNDKNDKAFICEYDESYPGTIWCICDDNCKFNYKIDYMRILNYEVELIEDEVDIDNIEEFEIDKNNYIQTELGAFKTRKMDIAFLNKVNELVQAVKQLNKEIKSIKRKKLWNV